MKAQVKLWIIFVLSVVGVRSTLAQIAFPEVPAESQDPPVQQPVTGLEVAAAPPPAIFPDWHEVARPEDAVEYAVDLQSPYPSRFESNNVLPLRVLLPEPRTAPVPVVLILHYWGASDLRAERSFAVELNRRGIGAAIMTLPYHLSRTPAGRRSGELAVEPDPDRLRRVMLQATWDARRCVDFLAGRPEIRTDRIGLMGTSLGGVVAALVYAVEPRISDVAFVVGGIDLAGILWNSSRVVPQRDELRRKGYTEPRLREELEAVEPGNYLPRQAPGRSFVIAGRHDTVIPRASTEALLSKLQEPQVLWLDTGHYGGIFVQRRLLREVARFFETEFGGGAYKAPPRLVAPTIRIGVKYDALLGPDLGIGVDLIRFDGRGENFLTAFATPSSVQFVLARRIAQGFAVATTASTRGFGFGIFWSAVL
ncbi:MAG TPA: prolyl oligopeptidase family serine peptidase [Fimbriimonas sp.]